MRKHAGTAFGARLNIFVNDKKAHAAHLKTLLHYCLGQARVNTPVVYYLFIYLL
jgi:hypothetical protein